MENKTNNPLSAKSDALKRLISEVFVLTNYSALQGLPSRLKVLGHHSAAEALTQILENEITAPVLTLKKGQQTVLQNPIPTEEPSPR